MKGSTKQTANNPCETKCGDSGCHCVSKSLENMDHLLLVSETGHIVTCLCGNYQVSANSGKTFIPDLERTSRYSNLASACTFIPFSTQRDKSCYYYCETLFVSSHWYAKLPGNVVKIHRLQYAIFFE